MSRADGGSGRASDTTSGSEHVSEPVAAIDVLLVEDDPGDVLMTREAFADYKVHNRLWVATNGVEAMSFLRREGEFADAPTPDLILLDLNLPKMDGREVLAAVKEDPKLRSIPVVVLTTSEAEEDVVRSYSLHANAYVTKPVDFERFVSVVQQIDDFFVSVVRLPKGE
jgi:two-component system response regulator